MPDPGFIRPDLCSIRAAAGQAEPAGAARGGLTADCYPPVGDHPPAPPGDRHRPRHPPVHLSGRARRGGHRGVCLLRARLRGRPGPRRDRDHRPARAGHDRRPGLRQLDAGAVRSPAPGAGTLPGPLAARAGNRRYPHGNMAQGWSGPGRRSASWARTNFWSGSSAPAGRQPAGRRQRISALARPAVLRGVLSRPQPLTTSAPQRTSAARQTRHGAPRVRPPGGRPSPPAGSVTRRRPGPAPAVTRRWPRTGSACRPATRCRNAGSPRCSDAHPAAGPEPESPMHDKRRSS